MSTNNISSHAYHEAVTTTEAAALSGHWQYAAHALTADAATRIPGGGHMVTMLIGNWDGSPGGHFTTPVLYFLDDGVVAMDGWFTGDTFPAQIPYDDALVWHPAQYTPNEDGTMHPMTAERAYAQMTADTANDKEEDKS